MLYVYDSFCFRAVHEIGDDFLQASGTGTAENARRMVREYFADLRDLLEAQEAAAISVVESHVRDRIGQLRQQQEDMATLTSQVKQKGLSKKNQRERAPNGLPKSIGVDARRPKNWN